MASADGRTGGPPLVVGLTGGIGSGKSTVAAAFRELDVPVIDADAVAREVVEPGRAALAEIVEAFGPGVLDPHGRLDRRALRGLVFADPALRARLEAILHPRIRAEMGTRLEGLDAEYAILEIPLLVETGQSTLVDRVLVVDAPRELQVARTASRDGTPPREVERIVEAQAGREQRLAAADDVISNDGTLEAMHEAVRGLHRRYLKLVADLPAPASR